MAAHAHDLRAEAGERELADHLERHGWEDAPLSAAERALCAYSDKLTLTPAACGAADIEGLRAAGWSEREINDAVQIIAYFNYINRVADGLGVDLEGWMPRA
ncbi:MAG: hypothetical protein EYC70_06710 [Planctomycetota bacterium]|nr:MAG: hypothetical protein EYC70_06710 [Planctomycetota bacterium]